MTEAAADYQSELASMPTETTLIIGLLILNILLISIVMFRGLGRGGEAASMMRDQLRDAREESAGQARALREELGEISNRHTESLAATIRQLDEGRNLQLQDMRNDIRNLTEVSERRFDKLTDRVGSQLESLRKSNEAKLESMRRTVDEKLAGTLEKRLGESFQLVSERLDAVHKGLGEMQTLAVGVGDLKAVLSNVRTRGTWGEIQLGAMLEQVLAPTQFCTNAKPNPESNAVVEFAVRLPGAGGDESEVLLPIDAKFPMEDYNRLLDTSVQGDAEGTRDASRSLLRAVETSAKDIRDKYINPPLTTDFAIMYLPTEGLYAEVVRSPEMLERMQRQFRVVVAGPTTLAAILNSLQMGFRTLAIEKRSSEVWNVLSAVKVEFGKFGEILDKVKSQISTVSRSLEKTDTRRRAMDRTLRDVERLPDPLQAAGLLGIEKDADIGDRS